jgi:uncharacterized protein DUF6496
LFSIVISTPRVSLHFAQRKWTFGRTLSSDSGAPETSKDQCDGQDSKEEEILESAAKKVGRAMKKRKADTLKSGRSGKKVKSRKQAIAIGLSEARKKGAKVPKKRSKK